MMLAAGHINFRDGLAVWRRNIVVHLRVWKLNLVAPIIEPVISVLGFGWGIGALVVGRVAGISYLSFAGAGLLGITVLMRAMFETTYASYFRMVYQSTYDAILATPVDAESLAFAEILWAITHGLFDTVIIMVVLTVFGAATSPWAVFAPLPLLMGATFMAGLSLGVTAHVHDIAIELTRAFLTGRFLTRHAYEAAYLIISAVIACEWAMRSLRRRMVA